MDYNCIEYWNKCDHANLLYQTGFKQRFFFDDEICKPEVQIEQQGYKDGEDNFIKTFEREYKIYNLEMLCYEFMLDALYTIPGHDYITLYLKNGENENIKDLTVKHEFITAGVAKVTITFRTRYIIKTNCCTNQSLVACFVPNHISVKAIIADTSSMYKKPLINGVTIGSRYLIYFTKTHVHKIMYFNPISGWREEISNQNDVIINITDSYKYMYFGYLYYRVPSVLNITAPSATTIKILGKAYINSFVRIDYKKSTDVSWTTKATINSSSYNNYGYTITGLTTGTSYDVRIYCYNHNCAYGYSNIMTKTTP